MINLGIIGLGTIFEWQFRALQEHKDEICVVAVYDIDVKKAKDIVESLQLDVPIYEDIEEFLADENIDSVLISTPPHTHFELAKEVMESGKRVLLEKPICMNYEKVKRLYEVKFENSGFLHIAYHASFAEDLKWYVNNKNDVESSLGLGKLYKVKCGFFDPYMSDGKIIPRKITLGGSYIDSAVNALSVCNKLVDLSKYTRTVTNEKKDEEDVVYSSVTYFASVDDSLPEIEIDTGWDKGLNKKTTELLYENGILLLDHSNQCVRFISPNIGVDEAPVLYENHERERLHTHYYRVFEDFICACKSRKDNERMSLEIHRLLFG